MDAAFTHAGLDGLFYEYDVVDHDPKKPNTSPNKITRSLAFLKAVKVTRPVAEAETVIRDIIVEVLSRPGATYNGAIPALQTSLSLDGLAWDGHRLLPSEPSSVPLAREATLLEEELKAAPLPTAAEHYRQAIDNFTAARFESSNGQLRSYLEALIPGVAFLRGAAAALEVQAALDHLRRAEGGLDDQEWAIFRALWNGSQDNGPHAGLTTADEARFRLHMATACGRYLLKKLPPPAGDG